MISPYIKICIFVLFLPLTKFIVESNPDLFYQVQSNQSNTSQIRIRQTTPVVNEGGRITLIAENEQGIQIDNVNWYSGSPEIAQVTQNTGVVSGIKRGFATVTASSGNQTASTFVVVTRVASRKGETVPGDTALDNNNQIYISNPIQNVILKAKNSKTASPPETFAGVRNTSGKKDGSRFESLFAGPTAIGVDGSAKGGLYITDTLNHSIRKVGFNNMVETILGDGILGKPKFDVNGIANFSDVHLNSPRGIAIDSGGNLFISDTDNNTIYYADQRNKKLILLAGIPGESGYKDGDGQKARFFHPAQISLHPNGKILAIPDQDNNRVRTLELKKDSQGNIKCSVSTVTVGSSWQGTSNLNVQAQDRRSDEIMFDQPNSVSFDGAGNINVVDKKGAYVIIKPFGKFPTKIELAQSGSFNRAASVTVNGTESIVLDAEAISDDESVKIITVGEPEIQSVTPDVIRIDQEAEIIITGKNFAPESIITFGGQEIENAQVVSATEIRFKIKEQKLAGARTISVLTRGGVVQKEVYVSGKLKSDIAIGESAIIAGGEVFTGDGGKATQGFLANVDKVISDAQGNLYIADTVSNRVRKVDVQTQIITTIAGGGISVEDGILAVTAKIKPDSIALDGQGNLYIADAFTNSIRRVDPITKFIETTIDVKEKIVIPPNTNNSTFFANKIITDIACDSKGDLYICIENYVFKWDNKESSVTTIAGGGKTIIEEGLATEAFFILPNNILIDKQNNLLINDVGSRHIYKINTTTGILATIINFTLGEVQDVVNITVGADNNLLVLAYSNYNHAKILNIDKNNVLTTVFDFNDDQDWFNEDGFHSFIQRIVVNGADDIFAATVTKIYKINLATKLIVDFVGTDYKTYHSNEGAVNQVNIGFVQSFAVDSDDNLYFADNYNGMVFKIDSKAELLTGVAGNGLQAKTSGQFLENYKQSMDDGKLATKISIKPRDLIFNQEGDLLIGDWLTGKIRKVSKQTGEISTIGMFGIYHKKYTEFGKSISIVANDIYVSATDNLYIGKLNSESGISKKIAGNGYAGFAGDGGVMTSAAMSPATIASFNKKLFFVSEGTYHKNQPRADRIRVIDLDSGRISRVAGTREFEMTGDGGLALDAEIGRVTDMKIDQEGNLFFVARDYEWHVNNENQKNSIRRIDAKTGIITTIIENKKSASGVEWEKIAIDKNGNLFVSETNNATISAIRYVRLH